MSALQDPRVQAIRERLNLPLDAKLAYNIPEAASAIGVSRSTIYEMISRGELELGKIAGRSVIPAESLREFFKRHYRPNRSAA